MVHTLRSAVALLLASALLAPSSFGQDLSPGALERVDRVFAVEDAFGAPGMAVGIYSGGELVYAKGFGMANLEVGLENGPDVLYRIGSTSKQFTATAVALLVLDGKLDLDAALTEHFPEFGANDPPIRVRDLLHHTSGIPDYINLQFRTGGGRQAWFTPAQSLEVLAHAALEFEPGTRFSYSNSNYLLLAELVQRVSGQTLRDFARERIFDPLGMDATRFQDRHDEVIVGRSHGYSPQTEEGRGNWKVDITHLDHVGDGGVFTSIEELAKWDANFYDNRLGHGDALLELLQTRGVLSNGETTTYAMGLGIATYRGLPTVSHGGSWVGYRAELLRFPEQHFSVAVLANHASAQPTSLARRVAEICLADAMTE